MRWGDEEVPVESRSWRAATGVVGYRKTYRLQPGELWSDAPVTDGQYEHLVDTDSGPLPVGVMIARELVENGADWAVMVELWGRIVLVDHDGGCVPIDGPVGVLLTAMRVANGGRWGGFADVVGARDDTILLRGEGCREAGPTSIQPAPVHAGNATPLWGACRRSRC